MRVPKHQKLIYNMGWDAHSHLTRRAPTHKNHKVLGYRYSMMVNGEFKTYRRYQPKWDDRLYKYMFHYYHNRNGR
jgi:hypothetical protein